MADAKATTLHVQPQEVLDGPITLVEYDPTWTTLYQCEAERVRAALGDRALLIEHVGSTAVPGLVAKPKVDIVLAVSDSSDESEYVPALEAAGYVLRIREPDWHEHRLFAGPATAVNLHVFSHRCLEIDRVLRFRDRLRTSEADRLLYERTKRALAQRRWEYTQNYADAKGAVIEEILVRSGNREHDNLEPRSRPELA